MRLALLTLTVAVSLSFPVMALTALPQTGLPPRDRPQGEPARGTASIRGQVFAADTGTPLRRAMVRVNSQSPGGRSAVAQTDAEGRFDVAELPAGRYVISVSRSGYVMTTAGARTPGQPGTPIQLSDGQRLDKVNIAMIRGGAITGRIVDEFGEPISDVRVSAERMITMSGTRRLVNTSSGDMTDDLGQFRLHGLPPGEYYVSASQREMMSFMAPNTASASTSIEGHAPTYYPGVTDTASARRVAVRAGQEVPNASFALVPARLGRISGRVLNSRSEPYANGILMVTRDDETNGFSSTQGTPVRPDGSFQTAPLPPGRYMLMLRPMGGMPQPDTEVARADVRVDGADVSDLLLVAGPGGIIRGRVLTDDGTVPEFAPRQVRVMTTPGTPGRQMMGMPPATVNDDWTFELSGLIDAVRLRSVVESAEWTLHSVISGGRDVIDEGIDMAPGRVLEDVDIVLTRKITELSGVVTNDRGQPVTDAWVVIFSANPDLWGFGTRHVRVVRPDTNGKYTTRVVAGDDLRVLAVSGIAESGELTDPEFLTRATAALPRTTIAEGERKTLDVRVAEKP
ncbi:MAG: carboxypeptidase regulatory-like domain-containing protein [Acidobacteria bacterium]|nr:carboxypeptidase regulatory-like domain-containing protein [Acidobacteriota bacterium]